MRFYIPFSWERKLDRRDTLFLFLFWCKIMISVYILQK